jgi:Cft2 family RNA processing exonuclease
VVAAAAGEPRVEILAEGLYLPAIDLFLDPKGAVRRAFVSHAHGDHVVRVPEHAPAEVWATRETLALVDARGGAAGDRHSLDWDESFELPIAPEHGGGTARLSLAPAGHILGAAQLVIDLPERLGGRLVYTGDYRTGPGATHEPGAPMRCDALIVESTFGLPIFRFPPREETLAAIVAWCRACIEEDETPALLGYSLGKAQALADACLAAGLPVVAHGAVYKMCAAYESLGVPLGIADGRLIPYAIETEGEKKGRKRDRAPKVWLVPPGAQRHPMIRKRSDVRIGYVSGWALIDAAVEQRRADAGFALSDHADYDDLMATIRATGARKVFVTHGDHVEVFARLVREVLGVESVPLVAPTIDAETST